MPSCLHRFLAYIILVVVFSVGVHELRAQYVLNGSVAGAPVGQNNLENAIGWERCSKTPDLCSINFPSYMGSNVSSAQSPDGGTWLGMLGYDRLNFHECATAKMYDLDSGTVYTLSFYAANFGTSDTIGNGPNSELEVQVDTFFATFTIPLQANTWNTFSLNFIAKKDSMPFYIRNWSPDSYLSVDGFTLECVPAVALDLGPADTSVCEGDTILLKATNLSGATFEWNDGSTDSAMVVTENGDYWVTAKDSCSKQTDIITVRFYPPPVIGFENLDSVFCADSLLKLEPQESGSMYRWQDGSEESSFEASQSGTYWLEMYSEYGCYVTDTIDLEFVNCDGIVEMPNIFSPNGDGMNDLLTPIYTENIVEFRIDLYNRWGRAVFSTTDPEIGWNGHNAVEGLYYYTLKISDKRNRHSQIRGVVQLVR